jgi:transcriptional regulator with XRE-family HTH domain
MSLSLDEKNMIIRSLIRDVRKKKKKSANAVANLCGLSQQYLSEIERGQKIPGWTVIRDIFHVLDVDFNETESLYDDAQAALEKIIMAYLTFDQKTLEANASELCLDKYHYSYAYFYHKLAFIVRKVLIEHKENLNLAPPPSSDLELRMLWLVCNAKSCTDPSSKLTIINDALGLFVPHTKSPYAEGLHASLLVDLAELKEATGQLYDALKLYETALTEASANYYTYFSLSVELRIASLYSKMGQFSTSNTLNHAIMKKTLNNHYPSIHHAAQFNLASTQMISGDYGACIKTALPFLKEIKKDSQYAALHYLLAFSYYMLDDHANAIANCDELLMQTDCSQICREFAVAILDIITENNNDDALKKLFKTCLSSGDRGDIAIAYYLLRKRLLEKEDYKSAYECANAYLSVLTN